MAAAVAVTAAAAGSDGRKEEGTDPGGSEKFVRHFQPNPKKIRGALAVLPLCPPPRRVRPCFK